MVLSSRTPCLAHPSRQPCLGGSICKSAFNSRKMFCRLGGALMPKGTLKASPMACPSPWYGSCPSITTRTSSGPPHSCAQLKIWCGGGNVFGSFLRKATNALKYGFLASSENSGHQAVCDIFSITSISATIWEGEDVALSIFHSPQLCMPRLQIFAR